MENFSSRYQNLTNTGKQEDPFTKSTTKPYH